MGKDRAEWWEGGNSLPLPLIQIFVPLLHIQSSFMTLLLHKLLYVETAALDRWRHKVCDNWRSGQEGEEAKVNTISCQGWGQNARAQERPNRLRQRVSVSWGSLCFYHR